MLEASPTFSSSVTSLGSIAKLLDSKYMSKRLKAACFSGTLGEHLHKELDSWQGRVYLKRWGTVESCIIQVFKLKAILLWGWDKDRFLNMSGGGKVSDEGCIAEVDVALQSTFWWACMMALEIFAICIQEANVWCVSCQCHGPWLRTCNDKDVKKVWMSCPMRGRRAPELAAGEFVAHMKGCFQSGSAKVAVALASSPVTQSDKGEIVTEFERCSAKLLFTFFL